MAEPDNLVLTLLRELRHDMNARFDAIGARFDEVDGQFAAQDKKLEAIREALKSETILGRYVVNGVDDRREAIEKRLEALESVK